MILDSHAYCFPPVDTPAGHTSGKAHLKWVQAAYSGHHQPAWRIRDRAEGSSKVLAPESRCTLSELPDLNFRADYKCGRMVWTYEGEDYTKQFFPPNLLNLEYTPESLISEMDHAGVDVTLLHTDTMLGRDSAYQAECVGKYPDRLCSMAPVDEWRIADEIDVVIDELVTAINVHGLHAIKFMPDVAYKTHINPWDDGLFRPFWQAAAELNVPVFFTLPCGLADLNDNASKSELVSGYLDELKIVMRWMDRYPGTPCGLTHGFPWRLFIDGDKITLPQAIWEPFANPNCHLEVSFPVRLGDLFDFPYRQVWQTFEMMVEHVGPSQLLWGTDMPFQNRFCTYRQSRDWIEKYCTFLSPDDLEKIMGATAARLLGV